MKANGAWGREVLKSYKRRFYIPQKVAQTAELGKHA
jgi:hypothetical protein